MPTLFESRAGNLNFTGAQRTLRTASNNGNACSVLSRTAVTETTISGIRAGATVEAAYLYWAGSGTGDYDVTFDGSFISAPNNRRYTATFTSGGSTYRYFSGVADVTTQVAAKGGGTGNGDYSFSGLQVESGNPYCSTEAVLAGWALLVIYSHPSEEFRVLNLYEGFQTFQNSSFTLNLSNFSIPATFTKGRIAHLTWEGDPTLLGDGENLTFNGTTMSNAANPIGNQFNSVSTITGATLNTSYGIDFDVYDLTSPIIQTGQTTATTTYRSGQDLVLLSAEIVAMPNRPVADLAVSATQSGVMQLGRPVTYAISVTNNGPHAEPGPIVVTNAWPAELNFASGSGSGWSCQSNGQSCQYNGPAIAPGASTPALTLAANVVGASDAVTYSVVTSGTMFDNLLGNNTAQVVSSVFVPSFVFTDAACVANVAFGAAGQTCNVLNPGVLTAGQSLENIFVTRLGTDGRPALFPDRWLIFLLHQWSSVTKTINFGLVCHNPVQHAGVRATYSAVTEPLPLCAPNGGPPTAWGTASLTFPQNVPSSGPHTFSYGDVGRVELFMKLDTSSAPDGSSGAFVVKPAGFVLSSIRCTTSNAANCGAGALAMSPAGTNPAATGPTGPAFIRAGHPFSVTVTAQNMQGNPTPNFGRETPSEGVRLASALAAAGGTHNPPVTGAFGSFSAGIATGTNFRWNEVGILFLTPRVADGDYLGVGDVIGTQSGRVGRFYPHHFGVAGSVITRSAIPLVATTGSINAGGTTLTVATSANITKGHELMVAGAGPGGATLSAMVQGVNGTSISLATAASTTVSNAAVTKAADDFTYMGEQMRLQLQVTAYSASDTRTQNYAGPFARLGQAALGVGSNWFATACSGASTCFGLGAVSGTTALTSRLGVVSALPEAWAAGIGAFDLRLILMRPLSTTPDASWGPFDTLRFGAAPRDQDGVSLPTIASDASHGMDLDADLNGTPERRELFTTAVRLGHIRVMSAYGTDKQALPIGVSIQYWNGSSFVVNTLDNYTRFGNASIQLGNFKGELANGETQVVGTPPSVVFASGVGQYVLAKPGGGDGRYAGSVDMSVNLPGSGLDYLTANVGRARFGVFKGGNQFIYMRENF